MPFSIVREDITQMSVDVIVNAANTQLRAGGGVCGAIFAAAGHAEMEAACAQLRPIETGGAVHTPGFGLPARWVIHTAGPIYDESEPGCAARQLAACYRNSLRQAEGLGAESIAFPLISAGIYGYPKAEALDIATREITDFLREQEPGRELDVYLVLFDGNPLDFGRDSAAGFAELAELAEFLDENFEGAEEALQKIELRGATPYGMPLGMDNGAPLEAAGAPVEVDGIPDIGAPPEDFFDKLDVPFSEMLLSLIDAKGMTDVEVYKRANMDRRLFSKIRAGKGYMPSKKTAVALAIALELTLEETDEFLERAGFALSRAVLFDVIIEYFITRGNYNIYEINEVLFSYDQQLLGG